MRDGPRCFGQDFSCPALLRVPPVPYPAFAYGALTRCGPTFQTVPLAFFSSRVTPITPARALRHRRFGLFPVRSPLLGESLLLSLPAGTKMFQFPAFAPAKRPVTGSLPPGCPIRTSADLFAFADPRGFSQLVTSFFASESPGIPHAPLFSSVMSYQDSPRSS